MSKKTLKKCGWKWKFMEILDAADRKDVGESMVTDEENTEKCEEVGKADVGKKCDGITDEEVESDVGNKNLENHDAADKKEIPNDEEKDAVQKDVQSDVDDKSIENLDAENKKEKGDVGESMETKENNKEPDVDSSKQCAVQEQEDKHDVGDEKCDVITKEVQEVQEQEDKHDVGNEKCDVINEEVQEVQEQDDKRDVGDEKCDVINEERPDSPDHSVV